MKKIKKKEKKRTLGLHMCKNKNYCWNRNQKHRFVVPMAKGVGPSDYQG
jgi:hypothetical protein